MGLTTKKKYTRRIFSLCLSALVRSSLSTAICGSKCLLSLRFLCLFVAINSVAKPRLHCDVPKHDFGTVIGGSSITNEFILTNRGDEPVKISKIKNCCGVSSTVAPMEIPPGSNAVCKAVFNTRNRYGKQDKQILIASNDSKHPYYELKMTGALLKPVDFSPRLVRLGALLQDSEISQTITATNLLEKAVELKSVSSAIKGITAEVAETAARNWTIKLESSPSLAVGKLRGSIRLNFSSGAVNVPVIGTVKPIVQVVPEQIRFSSPSSNETDRLVMLRSSDGRPFEILSANLENAEGSVKTLKLADNRWRCCIAIIPANIQSDTHLRVITSSRFQPEIVVSLSAAH